MPGRPNGLRLRTSLNGPDTALPLSSMLFSPRMEPGSTTAGTFSSCGTSGSCGLVDNVVPPVLAASSAGLALSISGSGGAEAAALTPLDGAGSSAAADSTPS